MSTIGPVTLEEVENALAIVAHVMRRRGAHGLAALPIFERLEREREAMANLDDRLDRALARAKARRPSPRGVPIADPRYSRISAA
jgi:hypothetical protein